MNSEDWACVFMGALISAFVIGLGWTIHVVLIRAEQCEAKGGRYVNEYCIDKKYFIE
jgi:hypothetical protein